MTTSIWWIRRDLRLTDNQALWAACQITKHIVPVFILDPKLLNSPYNSQRRTAFMMRGLRRLDESLRKCGSRLIVRQGSPLPILTQLLSETDANQIFAERDYSPFAVTRDQAIGAVLPLTLTEGVTIRPMDSVLKPDRTPYTIFTPYSKAWKRHGKIHRHKHILPAPHRLTTPEHLDTLRIPNNDNWLRNSPFEAGEAEAKERLRKFIADNKGGICEYASGRELPSVDGTSSLSPYLRFGMVSSRLAAMGAYEAMEKISDNETANEKSGPEAWLNELIWRDFYITILAHFPAVRLASFRPQYDNIAWSNDEDDFTAWCHGQTGYPFVDAAMRQLLHTGWMHNRARMVVASFLVKDLLIDWRWGEKWFMQHLIDGDPAANNGGWQWSAGTGTDAAPYFRIFNPIAQSKKFDREGLYIRRWIPELTQVPNKFIHEPWTMPTLQQDALSIRVGSDYPCPIVDHKWARERTLAAYKDAKPTQTPRVT